MTEIIINGLSADFEEEETIVASYGNLSFGELSKRKGVVTNTYKLPITNRNKSIVENAELINNASKLPYRFFDIVVVIDGAEVFKGYCYIRSVKGYYDLQAFSGISTFYNIISKKKLTEVDISEYNHIWDVGTITASWANTAGYIYGYVWYGLFNNGGRMMPEYFYPQVFFHTVIKAIIFDAGYAVRGRVLDDERFLRQVFVYGKFPRSFDFGDTIDLASTLPDVLQSKVILDFLNMYGLMLDIDEDQKVIYCDFIDDVIFNEPIDWSGKIDDSEEPEIFHSLDLAQRNFLRFKPDADIDNEYTSWVKEIVIDNESSEGERPIYTSEFTNLDSQILPSRSAGTFTEKEPLIVRVYDPDETYNTTAWRVFYKGNWYKWLQFSDDSDPKPPDVSPTYWELVAESSFITYKSKLLYGCVYTNPSSTVVMVTTSSDVTVPKWVSGDDLDWKKTYMKHYRVFDRIITDTKVIEMLLKLNASDINQLDFTRPYWFDRHNQLFILEQVTQYKLNEIDSTLCRFIRI